jgi:hypothetical protein
MSSKTKQGGWKSSLNNFDILSSPPSLNLGSLAWKKSRITTIMSYLSTLIVAAYSISRLYYYFSLDLQGTDYRSLDYKESPFIPIAQSGIYPWIRFNASTMTVEEALLYMTPVLRIDAIEPKYIGDEAEYDSYQVKFLNLASCGKLLEQNELSLYENNTDSINNPELLYDQNGSISSWVNSSLCINSTEFFEKVGTKLSMYDQSTIQLLIMGCDSQARNCRNDLDEIVYTVNIQTSSLNLTNYRNPVGNIFYNPTVKLNLSQNSEQIPILSYNLQPTQIKDSSDLAYFYKPRDVLITLTDLSLNDDPLLYNNFDTMADYVGESRTHMHVYHLTDLYLDTGGKQVTRKYASFLDVLAAIGGFYGTILGIFSTAMSVIFSQTTQGKILHSSMNIGKSDKKNKSKGNHTKVEQTTKYAQKRSESEFTRGQNSKDQSKNESLAQKDQPQWPTQIVSDQKFKDLAELIERLFDASSIAKELLKLKMMCSFLLDPETNKIAPLAGLVLIQNQAAESEVENEKSAIPGISGSSPIHIPRKSSGIDSLLESPFKNNSPSLEPQLMEAKPLASKDLKDKVDRREIERKAVIDDSLKLVNTSALVQSIKDLFHGYCKATIANSELNPYDQIDDKTHMPPPENKSQKELSDKPVVDLRTPDASFELDSRTNKKMI